MIELTRRELTLALAALSACAGRGQIQRVDPTAFQVSEHVEVHTFSGKTYVGVVRSVNQLGMVLSLDQPAPTDVVAIDYLDIRIIALVPADGTAVRFSTDGPRTMTAGEGALLVLGVLVLAALIVFVAILAMKSSCPFLYVVDRATGRRRLWGECYSGAVVRNLARTDLMRLPDLGTGPVTLVLANEAPETQYTDAAWLELVDHAPDDHLLATHEGDLLALGPPIAADLVRDGDGVDQTARVSGGEDAGWATRLLEVSDRANIPSYESLEATFDAAPERAVLELEFKNSPWLDRLSLASWAALGHHRDRVLRQGAEPDNAPRATELMRQSGIHTRVEVRQGDTTWRTVAWVPPPGWVGRRRVAVPLDGVAPGEPVDVRITAGIGFLFVYDLAVAPSRGRPEAVVVPARSATATSGADELPRIAAVDGDPNVLQAMHEQVELGFDLPPVPDGRVRAAFLRTHGWYEVHPPPSVAVDRSVLRGLRDPERFGAVGVALFRRTHDEVLASLGRPA